MLKLQNNKKKVALVGTGISGLSSLYFLLQKKSSHICEIDIFEKENQIGGVLNHTKKNGFIFEHGAQGVLSGRKNFSSLISDLNLTNDVCSVASKKAQRHVFFKNKLIGIGPQNLTQMFRSNLISIFTVFRIFGEFFIPKPTSAIQNETVESFFSRRFGKKITKNLLTALMKGIWGGGKSKILVKFAFPQLQNIEQEHKSILKYFFKQAFTKKRQKKEMTSFKDGMLALPTALFKKIQDFCRENDIILNVHYNSEFRTEMQKNCDIVIYSGQPWKEENFVKNYHPFAHAQNSEQEIQKQFDILKQIPTHSLIVVGIGSPNNDVQNRLNGFGALAVENNEEGVLGVICVHSLNPHHVPQNSFLYRIILGGENMPMNLDCESCSNIEIIQNAKQYLQKYNLLDINKTYSFEHVVKHFNYQPLPTEHQEKVFEAVNDLEKIMPGVFFTGNYILGPSVDSCIEQAYITSEKISKYII